VNNPFDCCFTPFDTGVISGVYPWVAVTDSALEKYVLGVCSTSFGVELHSCTWGISGCLPISGTFGDATVGCKFLRVLFDGSNLIMVYSTGATLRIAHVPGGSINVASQTVYTIATGVSTIKWVVAKLVSSKTQLVIAYHDSGTGQLKMIGL